MLEHYVESNSVLNQLEEDILKNLQKIENFKTLAGKVNRYFCQFLELLDQPMDSFKCCGNPEIITLDGIVISIEAKRIRSENLQYPWIIGTSNNRCRQKYIEDNLIFRATTRINRALINIKYEDIILFKSFTDENGLQHEDLDKIIKTYTSPCVDLLESICKTLTAPYKCPENCKLFFRSIRKSVCPAISITPKILWNNLRLYLSSNAYMDDIVSS